jgi:hypothetical protein
MSLSLVEMSRANAALLHCAKVRLLEPTRWQTVWRHSLDPGEQAVSVTTQRLHNAATSALESFITVGTSFNLGEDYPCTGRVLLFRAQRSEGDGSQAGGAWQGSLVSARFCQPSPDLRMQSLRGSMPVSIGAASRDKFCWCTVCIKVMEACMEGA